MTSPQDQIKPELTRYLVEGFRYEYEIVENENGDFVRYEDAKSALEAKEAKYQELLKVVKEMAEALKQSEEKLNEVHTGTDFEVECFDIADKCEEALQGERKEPCQHHYSRDMDQPYPRLCQICGEKEIVYGKELPPSPDCTPEIVTPFEELQKVADDARERVATYTDEQRKALLELGRAKVKWGTLMLEEKEKLVKKGISRMQDENAQLRSSLEAARCALNEALLELRKLDGDPDLIVNIDALIHTNESLSSKETGDFLPKAAFSSPKAKE